MTKKLSYNYTIYASYVGYITQAIVNNFIPLLFLTLSKEYELSLDKIALITTVNFMVQLSVDLISAKITDHLGYRTMVVIAHITSGVGLIGLAFLPGLCANPYVGILLSVACYAIGGGIIEVLISPIVEACPTEKKEAAMSLLHSFYCWGQVGVVLLSTAFFYFFGIEQWRWMACIWAIIPFINCILFLFVPIYPIVEEHEKLSIRDMVKKKVFWLILIAMICSGASEHAMNQWASAFAESALRVSKTVGDLAGPCMFAVCMGTSRVIYGKYSEKLPLTKFMIMSGFMCVGCYLLAVFAHQPIFGLIGCALCGFSVGIFWPGTFSIAAKVMPTAGTAMYALMALAGDLGCASGPTMVGMVANGFNGNIKVGLFMAMLFPITIIIVTSMLKKHVEHGF
ncbi:MAG: MFS transporter [Agathobacter sp.]|nr:MFS transporter [Agathobacter sp.]